MKKHVPQNITDTFIGNLNNKIQYVEAVLPEDGSFRIPSYQICKNWLKAREGRPFSDEDSQQYKRIVMILKEMVKLTEEIKTAFQFYHLSKMEIFEKVRAIVVEKLEIEPEKVTPIANFANDLGADSLDTLELVMALEEAFDIEISAQVAKTLLTVQQTIDYISQKVKFAV